MPKFSPVLIGLWIGAYFLLPSRAFGVAVNPPEIQSTGLEYSPLSNISSETHVVAHPIYWGAPYRSGTLICREATVNLVCVLSQQAQRLRWGIESGPR